MFRTTLSHLWRALCSLQQIVANTLLLALLATLVAAIIMLKPTLPQHAVLNLTIHGSLSEQVAEPSLAGLPFSLPNTSQTSMPDITQALKRAASDPHIRALWIDVSEMERAPLGRITTIIAAIDRFRVSGKPVVVYGDSFSQSQYLIATAADAITLHPTGLVAITGPAAMRHYIKKALDKLDVNIQLFRTGKYKSFAETLTRNTMSDAAKTATSQWLTQWWQQIKQRLKDRRNIKPERLQQLLDHPQQIIDLSHGDFAAFALHEGLVDRLGDRFEARESLNQQLGSEQPLPLIGIAKYLLASTPNNTTDNGTNSDVEVAIIRASGEIVPGEQPASSIGADSLTALIDQAADNNDINAVVLRIDSPGGSATASETIHRALLRLKKSGKPLVVSMGAMAASGGYWIATAADEIWAQPSTLTGSIGVFAVVPDFSGTMQRIGVQLDGVQTTALTDIRPDRPLDQGQQALLQAGVSFIYDTFLQRVATGRNLPLATVKKLAEGRVWSGSDAQRLQLVDHLGNLPQAIEAAAHRAGANKGAYHTINLDNNDGMWKMVTAQLLGSAATLLPPEASALLQQWHTLTTLRDPRGIYALADL